MRCGTSLRLTFLSMVLAHHFMDFLDAKWATFALRKHRLPGRKNLAFKMTAENVGMGLRGGYG